MFGTPTRGSRLPRLIAGVLALAVGAGLPVVGATSASAAVALRGEGTAGNPYLITSSADLDAAATAVNADTAHTAAALATYRVTGNLDYAAGAFTGFAWFGGTFDGAGHTIDHVKIEATSGAATGFFQVLSGATVEDLGLDHLTSSNSVTATTIDVGGVAGTAANSTISGIRLTNSSVSTPDNTDNSSGVGGLVGKTVTTTVRLNDNYLSGVAVSGDKRVGGVVGWASVTTQASRNLVLTTSVATHGNSGSGAAFILGFSGQAATATMTATDNVVLSGSIAQPGATGTNKDSYGWVTSFTPVTARGNLVNANNDIDQTTPVGLTAVPNPNPYDVIWTSPHLLDASAANWTKGELGAYATPAELAQQSTYDALSWDFTDTWAWDATAQHPVLRKAPIVTTTTTSITVDQGTAFDAAVLTTATGASIDAGSLSADLSGVDTSIPGAQTAVLIGTNGSRTTTVPVTVIVRAPTSTPTLTVPTTTVNVALGAMPTAAAIIAASGATADFGSIDVDFGSLTAADFRAGASLTVTLTATDQGHSSAPVSVTLDVGLSGAGTAGDPYLIDSAAALDFAATSIAADTAHSTAAVAHYVLTADIDYAGATFAGVPWFGGTFDGAGHTISNLANPTYAGTQPAMAMFNTVTGTIKSLTLSHLDSNITCANGATTYVGGLVNVLSGGTIHGVGLVDSSVVMTTGACATNSFLGGLVRQASGAAVISDNLVWNTVVGGNKYAAGIAAQASGTVSRNLVNGTIYQPTSGSGAAVGGIVEQGSGTITGNVLYGGAVTAGTGTTAASGGTHTVGGVAGVAGVGDATNLVSSAAAINRSSNGNATASSDGTAVDAAELAEQETYEAIGWDFTDGATPWFWDSDESRPALRAAPLLTLSGTTRFTYAAGSQTAAGVRSAILTAAAPALSWASSPSFDLDLGGVDFATAGTYTGYVTAADGAAAATPRPVTVEIVDASGLDLDVANTTIDVNAGTTLTASALITRAGATAALGTIDVDVAGLAAVNAAAASSTLGSHSVRLRVTYRGVAGPDTAVTVRVVAAGAGVIAVTSGSRTFIVGDPIIADDGALVLSGYGVTVSDGSAVSVGFPGGFDASVPGTYAVTLSAGAATPVEVRLILQPVPAPVITVAHAALTYTAHVHPTVTQVTTDLGVSIARSSAAAGSDPATLDGLDLSGVDFDAAGIYTVQVTGSWRGVAANPVDVTITVTLVGSGTTADPYQIGSAGDLDVAATLVNADTAHTGAAKASYRLTGDIDYGGDSFVGFTWFGGTFDGVGHTISDIDYRTTEARVTAMFVTVTGTIENLSLSRVSSTVTCVGGSTYYAAGVVDTLSGTLSRVALSDSDVTMVKGACATNSFVGGLARTASGTVTDSMVWNTTVTGNKYAGGLISSGTATLTHNIVNATINQTTSGNGAGSGAVIASGAAGTVVGNVVYGGAVGGTGTHTTGAVGPEATAGTPVGTNNLVSTNVLIATSSNQNTPDNGTSTSQAALALKSTYENLGWDFGGSGAWAWVDADIASHPKLAYLPVDFAAPIVMVEKSSITVSAQADVPTDAEMLAQFGAATDHGALGLEYGGTEDDGSTGINFELPGSYGVTVTSTDHGVTSTLGASVVITSLFGSGTEDDPLQLGSRADLENAVANLNTGLATIQDAYQHAHYVLTADINYAGDPFPGIDYFAGFFDGRGHTISNLVYTVSGQVVSDADVLGFFRVLDGATVKDLGLNQVTADGTASVGGLAGVAYASTLEGDSLVGATLSSSAGNAAGLVGDTIYSNTRLDAGRSVSDNAISRIANNEVLDTTITGRWVVGGIAAVAKGTVAIEKNLLRATLTDTAVVGPGFGTSAGGVLGAVGTNNTGGTTDNTVSVSGNVLLAGSLSYDHGATRTGHAGLVVGDVSGDPASTSDYGSWVEQGNLVSPEFTLDADATGDQVSIPGKGSQDGTAADAASLAVQSTYEGLGWDFATPVWAWHDGQSRPRLAAVPELVVPLIAVAHSSVAYQVGHVPDAAQILTQLGVTLSPVGDLALDLGGADVSHTGTYPAKVSGTSDGVGSRAIPVTIAIVPVVAITVAVPQVDYLTGSTVPADQMVADTGAALNTEGSLSADLSHVDLTTPGSYSVAITATDLYGFAAEPQTVTVVVRDAPSTGDGGEGGQDGDGTTVVPGVVAIHGAVAGRVRVGDALTADPGSWDPAGAPAYQWLRSGSPIANATSPGYTPTAADAGKLLQVRVTEQPEGVDAPVSAVSVPVSVAAGEFNAPAPTISGSAVVGQTLRGDAGSWSPAPQTLAYQWLRDGVPIAGATGPTYVVSGSDAGAQLSLGVTGSSDGYATARVTSAAASVAAVAPAPPTLHAAKPRIRGKAKVGTRLTVVVGTWSPAPRLTYQWLVGGTKVKGATKASFKLPKSARRKKVTVQVTGTLPGYQAVTVVSTATRKVK